MLMTLKKRMVKAMSEYELENLKPCFGNHEDAACSWHCFGCILSDECIKHSGGEDEQVN